MDDSTNEIRDHLARILASEPFRHSDQLQAFLRFSVEESLAGRGDRLKGYTIGVEALGRPQSFDPQIDPIVRVEASRLRRALLAYYDDAGAHEQIEFRLEKGQYGVRFLPRMTDRGKPTAAAAASAATSSGRRSNRLGWAAFAVALGALVIGAGALLAPRAADDGGPQAVGAQDPSGLVARPRVAVVAAADRIELRELAAALGEKLSRFELYRVATPEIGRLGGEPAHIVVELRPCQGCGTGQARVVVSDMVQREVLFSGVAGRAPASGVASLGGLANLIAAQDGLIAAHLRRVATPGSPLACYLHLSPYFHSLDQSLRDKLARCVANYRTGRQADRFQEQMAGFMAVDSYSRTGDAAYLVEALRAAERAIELGPTDAMSHYVKSLALARFGRVEDALRAGQQAAHFNANDALMIAGLGSRFLSLGDISRALPFLERAVAEFRAQPGLLTFNLAVAYFMTRREADFIRVMDLFDPRGFAFGFYPKIVAAVRSDRLREASALIEEFRARHPTLAANARSVLLGYLANAEIARSLSDAFEAAVHATEADRVAEAADGVRRR